MPDVSVTVSNGETTKSESATGEPATSSSAAPATSSPISTDERKEAVSEGVVLGALAARLQTLEEKLQALGATQEQHQTQLMAQAEAHRIQQEQVTGLLAVEEEIAREEEKAEIEVPPPPAAEPGPPPEKPRTGLARFLLGSKRG